jgi:hypothetical protein
MVAESILTGFVSRSAPRGSAETPLVIGHQI